MGAHTYGETQCTHVHWVIVIAVAAVHAVVETVIETVIEAVVQAGCDRDVVVVVCVGLAMAVVVVGVVGIIFHHVAGGA